jgi:arylsulfatase A-like enzyme
MVMREKLLLSVLALFFAGCGVAALATIAPPTPPEKSPVNPFDPQTIKVERFAVPRPDIKRVYLVSIDGCRPDILLRADTPNIKGLTRRGAFTFWCRSTALSITLPTHTSMLTGVPPRVHGIEWNRDLPLSEPVYPKVPTIFDICKKAGITASMVAGKSKFDTIAGRPGTVNGYLYLSPNEKGEDDEVLPHILAAIKAKPTFGFFHLPSTDNNGHKYGWGSKEQYAAVENADKCVGLIVQAIKESGVADETLLIVTADHGGAGKSHGPDDARCRHTPWVAVGPGVRKDYDLNTDSDFEVNVEDNFATALYLLGVKPVGKITGKPVTAIFQPPAELLQPAK